jgi:hypothetical protein
MSFYYFEECIPLPKTINIKYIKTALNNNMLKSHL